METEIEKKIHYYGFQLGVSIAKQYSELEDEQFGNVMRSIWLQTVDLIEFREENLNNIVHDYAVIFLQGMKDGCEYYKKQNTVCGFEGFLGPVDLDEITNRN